VAYPLEDKNSSQKVKLDLYLGAAIRRQRMLQGLKIADVAGLAGISKGMLSRIENAQVSTSLDTLQKLCDSLGLHLSNLFKDFDRPEGGAQKIKSGQGHEVVRRGTERGHTYHLLSYQQGPHKDIEPFLVSMDDASEVFPTFSHPGTEFIYMLKGKLEYRHGNNTYLLEPGDSLTFDAEIPHGPEKLAEVPIELLSITTYRENE
jgi:transcriptional regulator with XRE-family HTH domain